MTHIHIADSSDANVRMILPPASGGVAPVIRTYNVSGLGFPTAMAFDETHIHIADSTDVNIRMILPPTSGGLAATVRTYTVGGLRNPQGMAFDGTHVHILDGSSNTVRMVLPPTAGGQATTVRTYTVDGLDRPTGMAFDGTHVHLVDITDDNVRMILPPTSGGQASVVHTYTVDGLNRPTAMSFDKTHVHLADIADDNVRMILPPTADGVASIIRTYTVDGVNTPQGMAFDGVTQSTPPLTFGSETIADQTWTVGTAVNITLPTATGGSGTTVYSLTPATPTGITFTAATRALSGNPTTGLTLATFTYTATNGTESVSLTFTIVIADPLVLGWILPTNADNTFSVILTSNHSLSSVDRSAFRLIQRNPTSFMNLTEANSTITAVAGSNNWRIDFTLVGTYSSQDFQIRLVNNQVNDGAGTFPPSNINSPTWQVTTASTIVALSFGSNTISDQAWVVGTAVNLTLPTAIGGSETTVYSLTPARPAGVTFTAATRALAGNPTGRFALATFTYTATNGTESVELTFTVIVTATAIAFSSNISNQAWVVGTRVNLTLPTATGGVGAFVYSLSPARPSGVTFTPATRVLVGNPTGRFVSKTYTYTATDSEGVIRTQTFTIVVTAPAISFSSNVSDQAWVVGTAVNVTLPTATGGVGPFVYSLTSGVPAGVTFVALTRLLAGNPTGRFVLKTYTYTATDSENVTQTQTFTIVVTAPAIVFDPTSFSNQTWTVGDTIALTLPEGSGGVGTLTYELTPTLLPSGVTFTAATRALAGTPTVAFSIQTFTYKLTDSEGISKSITFTIVVNVAIVALSFGSNTISDQAWTVGTRVNITLPEAVGGSGTTVYSLSPTTPAEVTFTAATRVLSGNPTAAFTLATFTYTATNRSETVSLTFTIVITVSAISFDSIVIDQTWIIGKVVNLTLPTATGGVGGFTYSLSPVTPPTSITFVAATRVVSGIPSRVFSITTFTYTATDSKGITQAQTFTIVIVSAEELTADIIANTEVETRPVYITVEGETLAGILYRHYGVANQEILKQVLDANINFTDYPLILPQGTTIILPEINVTHKIAPAALWT